MAITNPGTQQNAFLALVDYSALAAQINAVLATCAALKQREATHAYGVIYKNTTTYTVNPDGTPGADDPEPVVDHPMTGQMVSSSDVDGFVGYVVNDLYNFLMGIEGPTTADRRPAIAGMLP